MIKRKKTKVKKRKNPNLELKAEEILSQFGRNIKFKYLSKGSYAETYYFVIKNSRKLNPGEYVLKVFNDNPEDWLSSEQIEYLIKLSNYGLIPKIYHIDETYMIMKYVRGKSLDTFVKMNNNGYTTSDLLSHNELNVILLKVAKLIKAWHKLDFIHGDLHEGNILLTDSDKIYLIDPDLERIGISTKQRDLNMFYEIYAAINYDIPESIINRKMKVLFS